MSSGSDTPPFGLRMLGRPDEPVAVTRRRVGILLVTVVVSANVLGAAAVFLLATYVIPSPSPQDLPRVAGYNLAAGAAYTIISVIIGARWGAGLVTQHSEWLRGDRDATPHEKRLVLQIPIILTALQAGLWAAAAALSALLNAALDDHLTVEVPLTVLMGGLVACTNCYLVSELVARPLASRALASGGRSESMPEGRLVVPGVRGRTILAWLLGSAIPVAGLMLVAAVALVRGRISATHLAITVLAIGGIAIVLGARAIAVAARASSDPVKGLSRALQRVAEGDLAVSVPIYDGTEIGRLQAGFNSMVAGLRERQRIREAFGRHVGEEVARSAIDAVPTLGGEVQDVAVLFADLIGSSRLAAALPPGEVVEVLNRFFTVVVEEVAVGGGLVNKFEGDGALAVFGVPVAVDDCAAAALAAARRIHLRLVAELAECDAAIGVAAGRAVAGNVGTLERHEYTVIGDPVNEASRLSEVAKNVPGRVLASWTTVEAACPDEAQNWEAGAELQLRGRPAPTKTATPVDREPAAR